MTTPLIKKHDTTCNWVLEGQVCLSDVNYTPRDIHEFGVDWVLNCAANAQGYAQKVARGLVVMHLPMDDMDGYDSSEWLVAGADFINEAIEKDRTVLVHCFAGVSRSPAVVAAYLVLHENNTVQDAIDKIHDARPCVDIGPWFVRDLESIYRAKHGG